jgi:hypothetical protein
MKLQIGIGQKVHLLKGTCCPDEQVVEGVGIVCRLLSLPEKLVRTF